MKQIKLTQGQYALVDDIDFDWLNQWKWCVCKTPTGGFYARRKSLGQTILMHRIIIGTEKGDKRQIDHKNHNTLDNQRDNLWLCSCQENQRNRKPRTNVTSDYKGVSMHKRMKKWQVYIQLNQKRKHLGYFVSEQIAAEVYNKAARAEYGEFAHLNQI